MLTFDYEGGGGVQGHDYVIMSFCEKVVLKKNLAKNYRAPRNFSFQNFDCCTGANVTYGLYLLNPLFEGKNYFSWRFFEKILPFSMVSIQEQFVIKSKL